MDIANHAFIPALWPTQPAAPLNKTALFKELISAVEMISEHTLKEALLNKKIAPLACLPSKGHSECFMVLGGVLLFVGSAFWLLFNNMSNPLPLSRHELGDCTRNSQYKLFKNQLTGQYMHTLPWACEIEELPRNYLAIYVWVGCAAALAVKLACTEIKRQCNN